MSLSDDRESMSKAIPTHPKRAGAGMEKGAGKKGWLLLVEDVDVARVVEDEAIEGLIVVEGVAVMGAVDIVVVGGVMEGEKEFSLSPSIWFSFLSSSMRLGRDVDEEGGVKPLVERGIVGGEAEGLGSDREGEGGDWDDEISDLDWLCKKIDSKCFKSAFSSINSLLPILTIHWPFLQCFRACLPMICRVEDVRGRVITRKSERDKRVGRFSMP